MFQRTQTTSHPASGSRGLNLDRRRGGTVEVATVLFSRTAKLAAVRVGSGTGAIGTERQAADIREELGVPAPELDLMFPAIGVVDDRDVAGKVLPGQFRSRRTTDQNIRIIRNTLNAVRRRIGDFHDTPVGERVEELDRVLEL